MKKLFIALTALALTLTSMAQTTLVEANFANYTNAVLVGQNNWVQFGTIADRPLTISNNKVVWTGGNTTDGQDAILPFASVIAQPSTGTVILYYDVVVTVNAAGDNPSYFVALNGLNSTITTGNYNNARLAAKRLENGFVFGTRVNGQSGYPFAYGTTKFNFGTKYAVRLAIEMNAGNANDVIKLYVGTDFNNLLLQATSIYTTGTVTDPTYGAILISQFGSATVIESGVSIESVKISSISGIITSINQLSGFEYAPGNGPSAQQSFTVAGTALTSGLTVTAPTNYEISALSGSSFSGNSSINIPANNGSVSPLTLYVRLKAGLAENTYNGNITVSSTGFADKNIALTGKVETPPAVVTLSTTSLSDFQYDYGRWNSTDKSFTISGLNLINGITINVPSDFEISTLSGSSFSGTNSLTIPHTNGTIADLTLYVRLKNGLPVNSYSGDMTFTTTGSVTKAISLSGTVNIAPAVVNCSTTSLSGFNYIYNSGPSDIQSFIVYGIGLTNDLVLSAPVGYEISSDNGDTYSNSLSFAHTGGYVPTDTITIRLKAGLSAQSYNGNLSVASIGAVNQIYISLSGSVTLPAGINCSTYNLNNFVFNTQDGPSQEKSFVVFGSSLSAIVVVTPPANYEISTTSGASFSSTDQIILQPTNNTLAGVTIYCRLKAGLTTGIYSGNINLSSAGNNSKAIALYTEIGTWTGGEYLKTNSQKLHINYLNQKLYLSEKVSRIEIYNIAGQLINTYLNTSLIDVSLSKGVYIVNVITINGLAQSEKVIVR